MATAWFPPSRPPVRDDWVRGTPGQVVAGIVLDVLPWVLIITLVALEAPRGLLLGSAALVAVAAVSLAVGAATQRSLTMRLLGWPDSGWASPTDLRAAWVEMFVPIIILLVRFMFPDDTGLAFTVATAAAAEAAVSAALVVTTGRSAGHRLLRLMEKL